MFEGQPKGLYALALANTGERFGYYTMLAIFTLFLQAKFGYTEGETSTIFGVFLASVYFLPLVGGMLADRFGYGRMVVSGFAVMFLGYVLLSIPTADETAKLMMFGALALIAIGTGLFKGNLQVMVGNLYEDARYSGKRDTAFSLFYMAINLGAMFAPTAAKAMTNYMLQQHGFTYEGKIPALAHQHIDGTISAANSAILEQLKAAQGFAGDTTAFAHEYILRLSEAYNYGFAVACGSLILSVLIYFAFRSSFKHVESGSKAVAATTAAPTEELSPQETKDRVIALVLVFAVVIFFWMAFHQNGLTMTFFARDYTQDTATGLTRIGFNVFNLALIAIFVYSLFGVFQSKTARGKVIAGLAGVGSIVGLVSIYLNTDEVVKFLPSDFQQFNAFFVVALTPVSIAIFSALAKAGKEPSAPRKIGLGMFIAALGFLVLAVGSIGLPTPDALKADASVQVLVSPNWLISTYLVLTFAELLLSPMGISFVSKVAPPKLKGAMMGGWFAATAIGNYLVSIIGYLWGGLPLWSLWTILIVLCLLSCLFIFSQMKKLEKVA